MRSSASWWARVTPGWSGNSIPKRRGSARWRWRRSKARRPCCPFDDWDEAWKAFAAEGRFTALDRARPSAADTAGRSINGAVATTMSVPAGGTVEVPFLLAWHYPNKYNAGQKWMGCHYATQWPDARAVLREAVAGLRHTATADGAVPPDVLRQHAALLAVGLRHGERSHHAPHRSGLPHRQRRRLWLGRIEWLLRPDLHACLGL